MRTKRSARLLLRVPGRQSPGSRCHLPWCVAWRSGGGGAPIRPIAFRRPTSRTVSMTTRAAGRGAFRLMAAWMCRTGAWSAGGTAMSWSRLMRMLSLCASVTAAGGHKGLRFASSSPWPGSAARAASWSAEQVVDQARRRPVMGADRVSPVSCVIVRRGGDGALHRMTCEPTPRPAATASRVGYRPVGRRRPTRRRQRRRSRACGEPGPRRPQ
jgi:hypothetical protein